MMKEIKKHRIFRNIILFSLGLNVLMCGFFFEKTTVELDTEKHIVYQNESAEVVIKAFEDSAKTAGEKYSDRYYSLFGTVLSKNDNNREFVIGKSDYEKNIVCSTADEEIISAISKINENDKVNVYGKLTVGWFGNIVFKADKVEKTAVSNPSDSVLSMLDGKTIDKKTTLQRQLGKNGVNIYIPKSWKEVEHNITGEELGNMPGYQYRLNELGKREAYAESFFVCYFDKKTMLADEDDIDENDLIEKAIIKDIFKKTDDTIKKFPAKKIETYYDASYKYYKDTFTKEPTNDNYKVEVIFQEKGEGIIVYVYVYEEHRRYRDDIMMVLSMVS